MIRRYKLRGVSFSFLLLLIGFATTPNYGQPLQTVSLSIDDAPTSDGPYFSGMERTKHFIQGMKNANVDQAVFFCNARGLHDPKIKERIQLYNDAGHLIANHTAHHYNLNNVSAETFIDDIAQMDAFIRPFSNFFPYFRYPYFQDGTDPSKSLKVKQYLKTIGLKAGYETLHLSDWYLNDLWKASLRERKNVPLDQLKELYLRIVTDSVLFYQKLALTLLHRIPHHILVFHENDLNALFIQDVINVLTNFGLTVVSPKLGYDDPVADEKWDWLPNSQRRLLVINKNSPTPVEKPDCSWDNLQNIKAEFDKIVSLVEEN